MCLERCNETIAADLRLIAERADWLRARGGVVAIEKYNLAANSTLVDNHLYDAAPALVAAGLRVSLMVSTYTVPRSPATIDWVRQLAANPEPFIGACERETRRLRAALGERALWGFNLDLEPLMHTTTADDARRYAAFVDTFARRMHALRPPMLVSVDVAPYEPFWNYTALARTDVDALCTMGTYASSIDTYRRALAGAVAAVGAANRTKLWIGLSSKNLATNVFFARDELAARVDAARDAGVRSVAVWQMAQWPEYFWSVL